MIQPPTDDQVDGLDGGDNEPDDIDAPILDEPEQGSSPRRAEAGDEDFVINHNGKQVRLDRERLLAVAQKGFDYESVIGEAKRMREEASRDNEQFNQYLAFRQYLGDNKDLASTIEKLCETYDEKGVIPGLNEEASTSPGDPMVRKIAERLERIENSLSQRDQEVVARNRATEVVDVIKSSPILARESSETYKKWGEDMVLKELMEAQARGERVADVAAHLERKLAPAYEKQRATEGIANYVATKEGDRLRYRSEKPDTDLAVAVGGKPPKLGAADLKNGGVMKAAMGFLRSSAAGD